MFEFLFLFTNAGEQAFAAGPLPAAAAEGAAVATDALAAKKQPEKAIWLPFGAGLLKMKAEASGVCEPHGAGPIPQGLQDALSQLLLVLALQ